MSVPKIIFLCSGDHLCRGLIAKSILQLLDEEMDVSFAGIPPLGAFSEEQMIAIEKLGYKLDDDGVKPFDAYLGFEFDYLVTLCHKAREQLKKIPLHYKMKLHLEFTDFCTQGATVEETVDLFRKFRDEIENELGYFYYHILDRQSR